MTGHKNEFIGGYDYQFVHGSPSDEYTCLICTMVAKEAQQASCCGKVFCKCCVEKLTTSTVKCPNCRKDLKCFSDVRAIRNINHFKVYCDSKGRGCTWSGELSCVEAHHDSCPYCTVQCPNQCTRSISIMDLQKHLQTDCPNRQAKCSHCSKSGLYHHISTDHLEICPDLKIPCPNRGCSVKPKRKKQEAHHQECPMEFISCEYADLGCEHVCLRQGMLQHNAEQIQAHLQLATKEARSTAKEVRIVRTLLESRTGTPQKHILKMTSFSKFKESKRQWYSPPFYIFPGGYYMCLRVDSVGGGDGEGTHISVFLYLMAGENDEILEWPMRGKFSIELLNQERDENHKQSSVKFTVTKATRYNSRVSNGRARNGFGTHMFMSHEDLKEESLPPHTQYLKDDTLYFRVITTEMVSKSKPWLAGAIA